MDLDLLFWPFERVDAALVALLSDAPLVAALLLATALGLRHATDPDHLVAVTALVTDRGRALGPGARIGAWWGAGHAAMLLALGVPLIAVGVALPAWLETGAERLIGVVIVVLAARVLWRWRRGAYTTQTHRHPPAPPHRHVHRGAHDEHAHRGARQAAAIGALHGLAGTGPIAVLLLAALPSPPQALAALAVFAPMSMLSMAVCTTGFAWALTRPALPGVLQRGLVPATGTFGVLFGVLYAAPGLL